MSSATSEQRAGAVVKGAVRGGPRGGEWQGLHHRSESQSRPNPPRSGGPPKSGATIPRGLDLRRRAGADVAARVANRADLLDPRDRVLLRAVFGEGRRLVEVGALTGEPVRRVRRRVRRLAERVLSDRFVFVAAHREAWGAKRRRVATAVVLHGRSLRGASRELGLSLHEVRREQTAVEAMYQAARR